MNEVPEFRVVEVDAAAVRPLRRKHLAPTGALEEVTYRSDANPTARHFAAMDENDRIVGIGSLHMEDRVAGQEPFGSPGMRLRAFAVEDDWRGRGVGVALVEAALEVGREAGVVEVWGNARTGNLEFYARTGFSEVSSEFELPGLGPHVVVARACEEKGREARKKKRAKKKAERENGD
jgi:GNAT superfamily N-acetyltransferase